MIIYRQKGRSVVKKILLIVPYFGKFNNYFSLWLKSAEWNNTIDFLIITDNFVSKVNNNIKVINMELSDMAKYIQTCFDFEISLNTSEELYKFRSAYGYIFSEYTTEYDFWGYCDMDLIFGDLREFMTEEILLYDKIFTDGHIALFRNCEKMNRLFMSETQDNSDIKVYNKHIFAETDTFSHINFSNINMNHSQDYNYYNDEISNRQDIRQILKWNEGKLYNIVFEDNEEKVTELAYVHFQNQKIECDNIDLSENRYIILPQFR